jgi:hypothetical protein
MLKSTRLSFSIPIVPMMHNRIYILNSKGRVHKEPLVDMGNGFDTNTPGIVVCGISINMVPKDIQVLIFKKYSRNGKLVLIGPIISIVNITTPASPGTRRSIRFQKNLNGVGSEHQL